MGRRVKKTQVATFIPDWVVVALERERDETGLSVSEIIRGVLIERTRERARSIVERPDRGS